RCSGNGRFGGRAASDHRATKMELDLDQLCALTAGKSGIIDAACPLCGPQRRTPINRIRKVLRIWYDGGNFATYSCARCGASGWAKGEVHHTAKSPEPPKPPKDRGHIAQLLWGRAQPIIGSLAEVYLRQRQCFMLSGALRFLPPRDEHPAAMVARFG